MEPAGATELVSLPAGSCAVGSREERYPGDGESPPRVVHVAEHRIGAHAVTNREVAAFEVLGKAVRPTAGARVDQHPVPSPT